MEVIKKHTNPEETVLSFSGKLDCWVRKDLQAAIQDAQTEGTQHVILDLTQVSFIDCATIGILIQAKQEFAQAHITLSLTASQGHVFDVLQMIQLDKMIPIVSPKQNA